MRISLTFGIRLEDRQTGQSRELALLLATKRIRDKRSNSLRQALRRLQALKNWLLEAALAPLMPKAIYA